MEIRQLEYFLMVSRVNSFTRAEERLYVSQPAVTNAIRSLEDELGIQLCDRNQKQALLTAEGKIFCAHVEQLMAGISNTLEEIHAIKNLKSGVLHIGLTATGAVRPFVKLLKNFMESFPNITIQLAERDTATLQGMLIENKLDLAFLRTAQEKSVLVYKKIAAQEFFICCGRGHKFRRKNVLRLEELADEKFIFLSDAAYRQAVGKLLPGANVVLESANVQTVKNFVAEEFGITILPDSLAESDDNLTLIPLEPPLIVELMLVRKGNRRLSHAAEAFLELAEKGAE